MNTYFAFEKELWSETHGVILKPNAFTPRAAPALLRGKPGAPDHHRAIAPSVHYDGHRFIMWYTGLALDGGSSLDDFRTIRHSQCIATSTDGLCWTKPQLSLGAKKPGRGDNVLFTGSLLSGVDYLPERKCYVMANSFQDGTHRNGAQTTFAVSTSADGLLWRGVKKRAVAKLSHFESCVGPKRIGDRYWIVGQSTSDYFKMPDGSACGRIACGCQSQDLVKWTLHPEPLFRYPANPIYPRSCLQTHLGFTLWPRDRIHLGLVGQIWPECFSDSVKFSAGLIYSYDGLNWTEPFEQTPLLGGPGFCSWHAGAIQGNSIHNRGDLTYHWYSATDAQGNTWKARSDIGLATVRRDGFAFFEPMKRGTCSLTTRPILLERDDTMLYVNADIHPGTQLRIEVLEASGERLPEKPARVIEGGVMREVMGLQPFVNRGIRVRFRFSWTKEAGKVRLYGFSTGSESKIRCGGG